MATHMETLIENHMTSNVVLHDTQILCVPFRTSQSHLPTLPTLSAIDFLSVQRWDSKELSTRQMVCACFPAQFSRAFCAIIPDRSASLTIVHRPPSFRLWPLHHFPLSIAFFFLRICVCHVESTVLIHVTKLRWIHQLRVQFVF